jgi:hypothetical protein
LEVGEILMGKEKEEKFEQYLNRFFYELMRIETCLELYVHIYNMKVTNLKELNIAPAFFGNVISSFFSDTIISLARIYENYNGRKRSDENLNTFLDFVEKHTDIFPHDEEILCKYRCKHKVDALLIKKHRDLVQEHKEKLDNLFCWRDKHYAHFDKKYFIESDSLGQDAEFTIKDMRELIRLAKNILNDYSIAYSGTNNLVTPTNIFDIDKVIEILYEHNHKKQ